MIRRSVGSRRGATLVLVAASMSMLLGIAALAIDFGRMYMLRTELKVATDAAALSAGRDLRADSSLAAARAHAREVAKLNKIAARDTIFVPDDSIIPGTWSYSTKSFTAGSWSSANAVKVTGSYTANWMLAKIFGATTRALKTTSVAALGAASTQNCMKPWAIPYAQILRTIGHDPTDTAYVLTQADIAALEANTTLDTLHMSDDANGTVPGNFGWVKFPGQTERGIPEQRGAAIGGCVSGNDSVRVENPIKSSTGNALKPKAISDPMEILCNDPANPNPGGGRPILSSTNCVVAPVFVPIYSESGGQGSDGYFKIRYIGALKLTGYDFSANNNWTLTGYLTVQNVTAGGGFKPTPGIVTSSALVK